MYNLVTSGCFAYKNLSHKKHSNTRDVALHHCCRNCGCWSSSAFINRLGRVIFWFYFYQIRYLPLGAFWNNLVIIISWHTWQLLKRQANLRIKNSVRYFPFSNSIVIYCDIWWLSRHVCLLNGWSEIGTTQSAFETLKHTGRRCL